MTLHALTAPPAPELATALAAFEAQFRYPLGEATSFSISHGRDYLNFFRAIGDPMLFVAEDEHGVAGTVAAVLRPLRFPGGATHTVGYLCDLKFRPDARREPMVALFAAVEARLRGLGLAHAYGVVMDGSRRTPLDYTGRLGIAAFVPISKVTLLRIDTTSLTTMAPGAETLEVTPEVFAEVRATLLPPGHVTLGGDPEIRSEQAPVRLITADRQACGLLEDTRRGKRLLLNSSDELRAAHLSAFAFASPSAAAAILRAATARCAQAGTPTLFASLPSSQAIITAAPGLAIHSAGATIYGCQMEPTDDDWWITSAEI
jgi:hypothetical protein